MKQIFGLCFPLWTTEYIVFNYGRVSGNVISLSQASAEASVRNVDRCGGYVADCLRSLWAVQSAEYRASIEKLMLMVVIIIIIMKKNVMVIIIITTNVMMIIIIIIIIMTNVTVIIIMNVVHETCDHTGNYWCHRSSNKRFKETFGRHTRKAFSSFTTTYSYARNIAHNTVNTAV